MSEVDIINYMQSLKIEIKQNTFCGKTQTYMVGIEDVRLQDDKIILVPQQDLCRVDTDDGR